MTVKFRAETATVPFGFAVNNPDGTGATDADSTPSGFVRAAGSTASDAPITTGVSVQLLSNAGYPAGLYEVIVNGTSASLSADTEYEVYVSATVDSVVVTGMVGTLITTELLDAAGIRSALGLASANLDTQLGTIDDVVDGIAADYATTDDTGSISDVLTDFTDGTLKPQVNIVEVNSITIGGSGTEEDPFGPA